LVSIIWVTSSLISSLRVVAVSPLCTKVEIACGSGFTADSGGLYLKGTGLDAGLKTAACSFLYKSLLSILVDLCLKADISFLFGFAFDTSSSTFLCLLGIWKAREPVKREVASKDRFKLPVERDLPARVKFLSSQRRT